MRIYISGKITGDPNYRVKFFAADQQLLRKGWKTLDPATLPDGMTRAQYMRVDLNALLDCDAVYFLPDAMESAGARIEWELAHYIGLTMYYDMKEVPDVRVPETA